MAGGTWETQNKIRPGVYFKFSSAPSDALTVGERGIVAICEPLSWGPVAQVTAVSASDDVTSITGYSMMDAKNLFLQQIFAGTNRTDPPSQVLLYRPAATSSAEATAESGSLTVTAKYPGARGNDISVVVTALTDPESSYNVQTMVSGSMVDSQIVETADELEDNDWVTFSGTGALTASAGTPLTGGADGTVAATAYESFMGAIESYKFHTLIYDGTDSSVLNAMVSYIKRLAEETGRMPQLVASGLSNPDSQYVINCASGVTLESGQQLPANQVTWWVGGVTAGANYNESLTYAQYPGAVSVTPAMTNAQYETALQSGQFVFQADDGVVRIEQDIDSLVTVTGDVGAIFRKNKIIRLCNTIVDDIYRQFVDGYIGIINNNEEGRARLKSAIVGYLQQIQANNGIQNFVADDVQVAQGTSSDAVLVNIQIQPVDAVEKIYLAFELQ